MKKCICWCLSIIELKNARWNIETTRFVVGCVGQPNFSLLITPCLFKWTCYICVWGVAWFRLKPRFNSRPTRMGFVVTNWHLDRFCSEYLPCSHVSVSLSNLHIHSFIHYQRCILLANNSIGKQHTNNCVLAISYTGQTQVLEICERKAHWALSLRFGRND